MGGFNGFEGDGQGREEGKGEEEDKREVKLPGLAEEPKFGRRGKEGHSEQQRAGDAEEREKEEDDVDGYDTVNVSLPKGDKFVQIVVLHYSKTIIWYFMVIGFCAARAATEFAVAMAYMTLLFRGIQLIGLYVEKPLIAYTGCTLSILTIITLFFTAMIHEAD